MNGGCRPTVASWQSWLDRRKRPASAAGVWSTTGARLGRRRRWQPFPALALSTSSPAVGPAELHMGDLHMDAALLADVDRLGDGLVQGMGLVANVGGVACALGFQDAPQGAQLVALAEAARRGEQAG